MVTILWNKMVDENMLLDSSYTLLEFDTDDDNDLNNDEFEDDFEREEADDSEPESFEDTIDEN